MLSQKKKGKTKKCFSKSKGKSENQKVGDCKFKSRVKSQNQKVCDHNNLNERGNLKPTKFTCLHTMRLEGKNISSVLSKIRLEGDTATTLNSTH